MSEYLPTMKKQTTQGRDENGQRVSSGDRQASLISAAASLFAAKGFNGTTTKEIAKAAGVSEALVFKYFPTKRMLYAAILAERPSVDFFEIIKDIKQSRRIKRCAFIFDHLLFATEHRSQPCSISSAGAGFIVMIANIAGFEPEQRQTHA